VAAKKKQHSYHMTDTSLMQTYINAISTELQELGAYISAAQLGQDVVRLRNILNAFPRYQHSLILGPDITQFKKQQDVDFLKNYFHNGGSALDGITWHP
jgi:hypothetical protein